MKTQAALNLIRTVADDLLLQCRQAGRSHVVPLRDDLNTPLRTPPIHPRGLISGFPVSDFASAVYGTDAHITPAMLMATWERATHGIETQRQNRTEMVEHFKSIFPEAPFRGRAPEVMAQYVVCCSWVIGKLSFIDNGILLELPQFKVEIGFDHRSVRRLDTRRAWAGPQGSARPYVQEMMTPLVEAGPDLSSLLAYLVSLFPAQAQQLQVMAGAMAMIGPAAVNCFSEVGWRFNANKDSMPSVWDTARRMIVTSRLNPITDLIDLLAYTIDETELIRVLGQPRGVPEKYTAKARAKHLAYVERQAARLQTNAIASTAEAMANLQDLIR